MAKLRLLSILALVVMTAVHAHTDRLSVTHTGPAETDEGFETVWTVAGGWGEPVTRLHLVSSIDAHVEMVEQEDDEVLAKVVVVGDANNAQTIFDVFTAHRREGLELVIAHRYHKAINGSWVARVQLASPKTLVNVVSYSSGSIVVKDNVLDHRKDVLLSTVSSGDVFADLSEPLELKGLTLSTSGSGIVQAQAPSIAAENGIKLLTYSSGEAAIVTDSLDSKTVSATTLGSGKVSVTAGHFHTTTMTTEVTGSGEVAFFSDDGQCDDHTVELLSSGDVLAGAIGCENVHVLSTGSGNVVVRATNKLTSTIYASGTVEYEGDRPAEVFVNNIPSTRHHDVEPAEPQHIAKPYRPRGVPRDEPHEVQVSGGKRRWRVKVDSDSDDIDISGNAFLSLRAGGIVAPETHLTAASVFVVAAVAAVAAVAVKVIRQHQERAAYEPLRSSTKTVLA